MRSRHAAVAPVAMLLISAFSSSLFATAGSADSVLARAGIRHGSNPSVTFDSTISPKQADMQRAQDFLDPNGVIQLCECEDAKVEYHGGLQCQREGWFISSFEAVGHWVNGGGSVPLSRAKCCRLCVPSDVSSAFASHLPANTTPTAVVSIGCHASTANNAVSCEAHPATGFITGFQHAIRVPSLVSATYYPEGPATCCSPALMLSNGDAWQIERCDCQWSSTVGCNSEQDGRLLWGYTLYRSGGSGAKVPIAPAECCKACVGDRVYPLSSCDGLNGCSRHGVCVMGACDCNDGWGGADCSRALQGSGVLPDWAKYLIMGLCVTISVAAWVAMRQVLEDYIERRRIAAQEAADALDPLLVAEGSVGEDDTDDEHEGRHVLEVDGPATQWPALETRPTSTRSERPADDPARATDGDAVTEPLLDSEAAEAEGRGADAADGAGQAAGDRAPAERDTSGVAAAGAQVQAQAEAVTSAAARRRADGSQQGTPKGAAEEDEEDAEDPELAAFLADKFDERRSPLSAVKCSVCFDNPVQVALVPCGHSNLCRKCARRLTHCPYCRKDIVRRQRLYLAS